MLTKPRLHPSSAATADPALRSLPSIRKNRSSSHLGEALAGKVLRISDCGAVRFLRCPPSHKCAHPPTPQRLYLHSLPYPSCNHKERISSYLPNIFLLHPCSQKGAVSNINLYQPSSQHNKNGEQMPPVIFCTPIFFGKCSSDTVKEIIR